MKRTFLLTLLAIMSTFANAQFSGNGTGTSSDPYQITCADELFEVRNALGAYYKLMNDIDLTEWIEENTPSQGWAPIGNSSTPFTGTFDGNSKSIKGLYINRNTDCCGLFGYTNGATISNLTLERPQITGGHYTGGVAGRTNGSITNTTLINPQITGGRFTGGVVGYAIGSIKNTTLINPQITGGDDTGGVAGYACSTTITNTTLINPQITGGSYTGGVAGGLHWNDDISSSVVIKGSIKGGTYVGGILGFISIGSLSVSNNNRTRICLSNNLCSANIAATGDYCGGIVGFCEGYYYNYSSNLYELFKYKIENNAFYGNINGKQYAGGIAGKEYYSYLYNNICGGNINAEDYSYGIAYYDQYGEIDKNVFCGDTIYSKGTNTKRISNKAAVNNYAYTGTKVFSSGKQITVNDGTSNGTSNGIKLLKKQTTYEGLGFDFTNIWAIVNGETFPYFMTQGTPVKATSFTAGSKGVISGTANGSGKVYVIRGSSIYEAPIIDNSWSVQLGKVTDGETVDVCVHYEDKQPSITTTATAMSSSVEPTANTGDANGDGTVDTADVVAIVNSILGKESSSFVQENADVNGDGEVLIDDAVLTVQMILDAQ